MMVQEIGEKQALSQVVSLLDKMHGWARQGGSYRCKKNPQNTTLLQTSTQLTHYL